MARYIDLTGQKFGRLTVIKKVEAHTKNKGRATWLCQCECGNTKRVLGQNLRNGHVRSCGCLAREKTAERSRKHGYYGTRLYQIYIDMVRRCHNPKEPWFQSYGAKGITVCEEWRNNPKAFFDWAINNGYNDNLTIDRIDGTKGYSPENCRWVDFSIQNFNKPLSSRNTSGYKGVSFNKATGKYVAYISRDKKFRHLGTFDTAEEAYKARLKAEKELYSDLE